MLYKIQTLIDEISTIKSYDDFLKLKESLFLELKKIGLENDKLNFKYERSNKEKNILSSLLTNTSADLKKVSDNLKIRAEELSIILDTIPAYIYFKDIHLKYVLVNRSFEDLLGLEPVDIIGKHLNDLLDTYHNDDYLNKERFVLETGKALYDLEEEVEINNTKHSLNTNIASIKNAEGVIIGIIGISLNITERKQNEKDLLQAKELAEAGTLAKNEFIASVSHEFRTPMNGILGLSEILRNTNLNNEQLDLLKGIISSADNLLVLLNDVLDFSAIEAGKMELDYHPFDLNKVLNEIDLVVNIKAKEKCLEFNIIKEDNLPETIIGDPSRLRQIIINLANNAVKFTENGKVNLIIKTIKNDNNNIVLKFDVADTGIGIPKEALNSLFQVFSRIKQEDKSKLIAGTGLGLSICKKLTDMMGGEIGVESTFSKGSLFWFTLPFVISNEKMTQIEMKPLEVIKSNAKKLILVVDDNQINQRIAKFNLQKMGFDVELASDGQEALQKYCTNNYDLIVLDIQMPVMDGYQVAKAIRDVENNTARHTPIIALTANAMKGDKEKYINAGMDDYISKPFTLETFSKVINNYL
ncbi:MAG: response regulator [Bacteroidota bacterium]